MRKLTIIFTIGLLALTGYGTTLQAQQVQLNITPEVASFLTKVKETNRTKKWDGWRVLLLTTTDRRQMEAEKRRLEAALPTIPIMWEQAAPNYKIKAGAFETKMAALRYAYIIKDACPNATPTMDKNIKAQDFVPKL